MRPSVPGLQSRPSYRWLVMSLFMAVASGTIFVQFSIGVALPDMSRDLDLSGVEEGFLSAIFPIGAVLLYIPLTGWMSRRRPVALQTVTGAVGAALILLMAVAPSYPMLLLARFLFVVTWVSQIPIRTALIQDWFEEREVVKVNAVTGAIWGATEAVAIAGTAPLIDIVHGWRGTLVVFAALTAVATLLWWLLVRDHGGGGHEARLADGAGGFVRAFRYREVWLLGMVIFGSGTLFTAFLTFWPTYATEQFGLSLNLASAIFGLGSVAVFVGSALAGVLVRFTGQRFLIWSSMAAFGPVFFGMLATDNVPALFVFSWLQGLTAVSFPIVMSIPFQIHGIRPREVAIVSAALMVVMNISAAFGPAFTGILSDLTSLRIALATTCLFPAISVAGALLLREQREQRGSMPQTAAAVEG